VEILTFNSMKNSDKWQPSKYVTHKGQLVASRDPKEVSVSSRLITDLIAGCYATHLKIHARGRLLDLGCGKVPLYEVYRPYIVDNICVDWQNTPHRTEHLDYETDLTRELPFREGEFDTIILSDVLEHVPEPEHVCGEIARILSPGGKLLMNVPFYYWLHETPYDYYRYTEFALRRFMERSGMRLLQLHAIGGAPEIMADILAKNVIRLPVLGAPAAMFSQWAVSICRRTSIGRRISNATAESFPFGYFLVAEKPD
jgi:SAM-dependent methyltransferase